MIPWSHLLKRFTSLPQLLLKVKSDTCVQLNFGKSWEIFFPENYQIEIFLHVHITQKYLCHAQWPFICKISSPWIWKSVSASEVADTPFIYKRKIYIYIHIQYLDLSGLKIPVTTNHVCCTFGKKYFLNSSIFGKLFNNRLTGAWVNSGSSASCLLGSADSRFVVLSVKRRM